MFETVRNLYWFEVIIPYRPFAFCMESRGPCAFPINNFYNRWWKSNQICVNICGEYFTVHCFQINIFKSLSWPHHSQYWLGMLTSTELFLGSHRSRNRSQSGTAEVLKYLNANKKELEDDLCFELPINEQSLHYKRLKQTSG